MPPFFDTMLIASVTVLIVIAIGWIWRLRRLRRIARTIDQMEIKKVEKPTDQDKQAYEVLKKHRKEVWSRWEEDTVLSPQVLFSTAYEIVGKIATVYYPEAEEPIYKATVEGLMDLNVRIVNRLKDVLDKPLVNKLRGMDVETVMKLKKGFDFAWKNPLTRFIRQPTVRRTTRMIFDAVNVLNPWYWGRKIIFDVGIESAKRFFITSLVTIVGEESVMLFSERRVRNEKAAAEMFTAYAMVRALQGQKKISSEEYQVLHRWLIKFRHLDSHYKFELLRMMHDGKQLPDQDLSELKEIGGIGLFVKAFAELVEARGENAQLKLDTLEEAKKLLD